MKLERFLVKVEDSRFSFKSPHHRLMFQRFMKQYDGMEVFIQISEQKSTRSEEQHRYYFLYLRIISEETGNTVIGLHTWAKKEFLTQEQEEVFGTLVDKELSTKTLKKGEFIEYLLNIQNKTGVPLPDTNGYWGSSYHK